MTGRGRHEEEEGMRRRWRHERGRHEEEEAMTGRGRHEERKA